MRAVVVQNQMNLAPARSRSLHPLQKRQEFGVAVPRPAVADDGPVQDIKNRKQGRGAKADAIMRLVRRESWPQRQARLRSIQGLDLALLVHAQHQRLVWWVEVEPHHVSQFADEVGVPTQLEGLGAMRLQAVGAPDAPHGGLAHALRARHAPGTPVRRVPGGGMQRGIHDGGHLRGPDALEATWPWRIFQQARDARLSMYASLLRHFDVPVGCSVRRRVEKAKDVAVFGGEICYLLLPS